MFLERRTVTHIGLILRSITHPDKLALWLLIDQLEIENQNILENLRWTNFLNRIWLVHILCTSTSTVFFQYTKRLGNSKLTLPNSRCLPN